jgi:putative FmdB family regulatory protein
MPIYEYQCQQCRHTFEDLVGMGWDDAPSCCPKCNSANVKRVFSKFSFFDSSNTWRGKKDGNKAATSPSDPKDAGSKSASPSPSSTTDTDSKSASPRPSSTKDTGSKSDSPSGSKE